MSAQFFSWKIDCTNYSLEVMKMFKAINLKKVKTYSIRKRYSKVKLSYFSKIPRKNIKFADFYKNLPDILASKNLKLVVDAVVNAHRKKKPVIFMMGGHVIKCGLSPVVIELMKRKIVTAIAMNGAASIHDFEIGMFGKTSEDVAGALKDGSFGMAEETGSLMNKTIKEGNNPAGGRLGMGEALGEVISHGKYTKYSILAAGFKLRIPVTVHVAIGTDIIHQHPLADGASLGETSFKDFLIFSNVVSMMGNGGVVFNLGSAVVMPEVFLKALTISRNLGSNVKNFTSVNFDMIQHYRPNVNVLDRPTLSGGNKYAITGHHEIMIPLLAQAIMDRI